MSKTPEWSAEELNFLIAKSRDNEYWANAKSFVFGVEEGINPRPLTNRQIRWLWMIKNDVRELMGD